MIDERRRFRRDTAWNLVPVLLLAVVGLGLNFLVGRWWGEAALGSFNLVTTALIVFGVLGACGLQYAVLRAVAEAPDDRERVAAVVVGALLPNVACAAASAGVFVLLRGPIGAWLDSPAVSEGMLCAAPALFCFALNKTLLGVVNGLRRMRAFAVYTSIRYVLILLGVLGARALELEAAALPLLWTFVEGVLLLVLLGELVSQVSLAHARGWATHMRAHLAFGLRGVAATLATELNSRIDVWLLGVSCSDATVGIYSLAAALREGALQLGVVLQNNLNPMLAHAFATRRHAEVPELARRTRRWFVPAVVVLCALGAAAYPLLIPWWTGSEAFGEGSVPFAILIAGVALASPWLPFGHVLLMAARPGWHTLYLLVVLVLSYAGCALLIPPLGLTGAALGISASLVASVALLVAFVRGGVGVRI